MRLGKLADSLFSFSVTLPLKRGSSTNSNPHYYFVICLISSIDKSSGATLAWSMPGQPVYLKRKRMALVWAGVVWGEAPFDNGFSARVHKNHAQKKETRKASPESPEGPSSCSEGSDRLKTCDAVSSPSQ